MKQDKLGRHLLISFVLALGLYVGLFWLIESRRTAQTPWTVWFETNTDGRIKLEISQQSLGLGPVEIRFDTLSTNRSLARTQVEFRTPKEVPHTLPTGDCLFEDLTFLPGTVAIRVGAIDVQMLPRALTVGTNEFAWEHVHVIQVQTNGNCRLVN